MKLVERVWTAVSYLGSILTLSPFHDTALQHSLQPIHYSATDLNVPWPRFYPTSFDSEDHQDAPDLLCDYPEMKGWQGCSTESGNACWIRNPETGEEFNITTNYEDFAPIGVTRPYELHLNDSSLNTDGIVFKDGKIFNNQYPGPWIQACWGDTVEVKVYNHLRYNGTSIHWHGIRMNQTMHMDGVNGVSQCPTAPGDYFIYRFHVTQYGSSWYHSHYSLQYADGAAGPITFHGPTSAKLDEVKKPFLMTDWLHNSAFWSITQPSGNKSDPNALKKITRPSYLINGRGDVRHMGWANETAVPPTYNITFAKRKLYQPAKKYLLRIINTSFDTTFIFSIDNHALQVVEVDFVPIHPYKVTSVLVGIGQRYHVIVEGDPIAYGDNTLPEDGNYWIRTYVAPCFRDAAYKRPTGYEQTAILRYDSSSTANPNTAAWGNIELTVCADEPASRLSPILPWFIGNASNNNQGTAPYGEEVDVLGNPTKEQIPPHYPLAWFSLFRNDSGWNPMRVNYSDPIFGELDNLKKQWPREWSVIPEQFGKDDWVFIVVDGTEGETSYGAHPLHLHGHDFAMVQVGYKRWDPKDFNPNLVNPARRDVVLLPSKGYVIIAFKTDNPGSWLLHCHIASHASEGLGFQILERQADASKKWPPNSPEQKEVERGCKLWKKWEGNRGNWFNATILQDDSGI